MNTTVWPGEFLEVDAPADLSYESTLAIEPRTDSVSSSHRKPTHAWPQPHIIQAVGCKLRLLNNTEEPLLVRKNDHFCQASLAVPDSPRVSSSALVTDSPRLTASRLSPSESGHVDPDGLMSPSEKAAFSSLLKEFQTVFDPNIVGCNGAAGPIEGVVNMGPVEPPPPPAPLQRKRARPTVFA